MPRPRKQHVQQELVFRTHGGKRAGAGRPPKGPRSSEPHQVRDELDPRFPLHVTTRVVDGVGSLRKKDLYLAIRQATLAVFAREGFVLAHVSIQRTHLHLLVEAVDQEHLAKGLQALLGSAAQRINRALWRRTGRRRTGTVFADRYHARPLTTPRAVRHALAYVLNNFRRHGEDRAPFAGHWKVDPYSSGAYFTGWQELGDVAFAPRPEYVGLLTRVPRTWLLRVGWRKAGPVSIHEVPGRA